MEKYGFVYIWYDRKHKRYYIGCHWGREDDGYVCSSTWMRNAYKRRPQDFKRRVIERNITCRRKLLDREHVWLGFVEEHELGDRYYNLTKHHNGHWTTNEHTRKSVGEKISASPQRRENISRAHKGKTLTEEHRLRISAGRTGISTREGYKHSQETLDKLKGRKVSDEVKAQLSAINKGKTLSLETRAKMSSAKLGRKHSAETIEKIRINKQRRDQMKRKN